MSFFRLLIFSCGILNVVYASSLIVDTLRCSRYWPQHIDLLDRRFKLPETLESLDQMCRWHQRFFNCLRDVSSRVGDRHLPVSVERSENISKQICEKDSMSKKSYVETARCINRFNPQFCCLPGMDDKLGFKSGKTCDLHKKAVGCFAMSLSFNCDNNAFSVFLNYYMMLHWEADECDFVTPGIKDSAPKNCIYTKPSNRGFRTIRYSEDGEIVGVGPAGGLVFIPNREGTVFEREKNDHPLYKGIKTALDYLIDYVNELSENASGPKLHESPETVQFSQGNYKQSFSSMSAEKMVPDNYADYNNIVHYLLSTYESAPQFIPKNSITNYPETENCAINRNVFHCGVKPLRRNSESLIVDKSLKTSSIGRGNLFPELKANIYKRYPKKTTSKQWIIKPPTLTIDQNTKNEYCSKDRSPCFNDMEDLGKLVVDSNFEESTDENSKLKFFDVYRTGNSVHTDSDDTLESRLEDISDESCVQAEDMAETDPTTLTSANPSNVFITTDSTQEKILSILEDISDESYVQAEDMSETDPTTQTSANPSNVFIPTENTHENILAIPENIRSELVKMFLIPAQNDFKIVEQPNFRLEFKMYKGFSHIERITCERVSESDPLVKDVFKCSIIPRDIEQDYQNEISPELSNVQEHLAEQMQYEMHDDKVVKISDLADYIRSRNHLDMQTADNTVSKNERKNESEHSYESDSNIERETPEIDLSTESADDLQLYLLSTDAESIQKLTEDSQLVLIEKSDDDQPEFVYSIAEQNPDSDNKPQPDRLQSENVDTGNESVQRNSPVLSLNKSIPESLYMHV